MTDPSETKLSIDNLFEVLNPVVLRKVESQHPSTSNVIAFLACGDHRRMCSSNNTSEVFFNNFGSKDNKIAINNRHRKAEQISVSFFWKIGFLKWIFSFNSFEKSNYLNKLSKIFQKITENSIQLWNFLRFRLLWIFPENDSFLKKSRKNFVSLWLLSTERGFRPVMM